MEPASAKYKKYWHDEYSYQSELIHNSFTCPNCAEDSVKVSIDRDAFTDKYFIRAVCRSCNAYSIMQMSPLELYSVKMSAGTLMANMIYETVYRLKNASEIDLDTMIDKDWELAGG